MTNKEFDSSKDDAKTDFNKACDLYRSYISTAETDEERLYRIRIFRRG